MTVKAIGPLDAKIMLVGEAPGKEEEIAEVPFVGAAGKLLNQFLSQVMISRDQCFITNVMVDRPINNDFGTFYEDKSRKIPSQFLLDGYNRLREEVQKVKPNVIVALGNEALRALTGLKGITKYRGSILPSISTESCYKIIPVLHPAAVMRMWDWAPLTIMDLTRVKTESESPLITETIRTHRVIKTIGDLEGHVKLALRGEYLSFDIETCNNQISCIGFATSDFYAFVTPIHMFDTSFWSELDEKIVWTLIRKLLESSVKKIAQKADFDMFFIKSTLGISVNNLWMDTMCAFHCLAGDTLIDTLQGRVSIKELVGRNDVWVWSCNDKGVPIPAKASSIRLTQKDVELVRVSYWYRGSPGTGIRKEYIDMTPDHKVRLLDGRWVEARDLLPGDSLTRLRLTQDGEGRSIIYLDGRRKMRVSRYIAELVGTREDIVHHKDGNITNDNPENLTIMSKGEHNKVHGIHWPRMAPWNKGRSQLDDFDVKGMYESGMSTIDIAKATQVDQGQIVRYMQSNGIERRTLSQAQQLRRSSEVNAKVVSVKPLDGKTDVYNMDVDIYHCFSANHVIVHNCVYPELRKGLDILCSVYTDQPYYKDMISTDYYRYNALDCMITYECAMKIKEELKEFRTWGFYKNVVNPMINIILKMELRGVKIDIEKKDLATIAFEEDIKALQEKLDKAIGHELNVNAPKQVAEFLYVELGLPEQYNRKTGRITTDEKAIQRLTVKYPSIVFDYLLKLKEKKKIHSTYLTTEVDEDGRIRCSYILSGTKSGRLASRMSRLGSGMNLQNVPKGICREIVIPDEGCMFISADLSQAEARVVAYLAGEEQLIRIFESGGDVHAQVAMSIFDKPANMGFKETDVTKEERNLAKHIVHACNYGMGPMTFGEVTGLGFTEAKEKLNLYHINFPRIRRWQDEIEAKLRKSRTLETPLGRRRTFFGRWNSELVRDAYSYIPQSTVADAVLMGMIELDRRLPRGCEILLNIHDEVVVQAGIKYRYTTKFNRLLPEDSDIAAFEIEKEHILDVGWLTSLKELIVECMTIPIKIGERVLKIPVNTKHGYNWNEVS